MPSFNPNSAKERIKNHLIYKLGLALITYDKQRKENLKHNNKIKKSQTPIIPNHTLCANLCQQESFKNTYSSFNLWGGGQNNTYLVSLIPFAFLKLLLCLYKIKQTHKKQQQFYKQTIQLFPNLKYPSLQSCKDYQQSLCFQYHLTYLLGEALSKADKIWYKGGYFTLNKKIKEAKHIYKLHQEYKAILKVFNLPYCFIPKESLLQTLSFLKALKHLYNASDSKTTQTFFLHFFNQIPFYTQRPFLLKYKEEILEWLESKEFKEQYIKTNHPYPPLLNPKRLYKKESIEVKSQREDKEGKEELKSKEIKSNNEVKSKEIKEDRNRETKEGKEVEIQSKETQSNSKETKEKETQNIKGIIKEISKQQEIQNQKENREELVEVKTEINKGIGDRDSENVESKNEESLQPYANLSYESIPASLAWDLNLPLVGGYNGIWLYNSSAGGEATQFFFGYCEGIEFCTLCWRFKEYKSAYIYLYQNYLESKNIIFSFNAWQKGAEKFGNLLDKKVPIFSITRDYISRLKTGVNHIVSTESITKFKNFSLKDEISFPQIYYRGAYKNKPDINILKGNNFSLMWGDLGGLGLRLKWLKNAISKVYFIPIDAISGERAFYTFMQLSKILHFNLPQNSKAFSGKVNRYEGLIMLPCNLRVDTKDVDKHIQEIQVLITTYQLHPNYDNKLINIMNFIKVKAPQDNLVLYVKQEEFRVLMENKTLLRLLQEYFEKYFSALRGYIKNTQDNLFSEQDILNYFKNHPKLALEFKKQVQGDIEIIKSQSPHIIDSWKYYQEFLRICEEG